MSYKFPRTQEKIKELVNKHFYDIIINRIKFQISKTEFEIKDISEQLEITQNAISYERTKENIKKLKREIKETTEKIKKIKYKIAYLGKKEEKAKILRLIRKEKSFYKEKEIADIIKYGKILR